MRPKQYSARLGDELVQSFTQVKDALELHVEARNVQAAVNPRHHQPQLLGTVAYLNATDKRWITRRKLTFRVAPTIVDEVPDRELVIGHGHACSVLAS